MTEYPTILTVLERLEDDERFKNLDIPRQKLVMSSLTILWVYGLQKFIFQKIMEKKD